MPLREGILELAEPDRETDPWREALRKEGVEWKPQTNS